MRCSRINKTPSTLILHFWQMHLWYSKSTAEDHTWVTYPPGMGLVLALALHRFWGQKVRMAVGFEDVSICRICICISICVHIVICICICYVMYCNVLSLHWYLSILCLCSVSIYSAIQTPTLPISIRKHPTNNQCEKFPRRDLKVCRFLLLIWGAQTLPFMSTAKRNKRCQIHSEWIPFGCKVLNPIGSTMEKSDKNHSGPGHHWGRFFKWKKGVDVSR